MDILKNIYELNHKLKRHQICSNIDLKELTSKQLHILKYIMQKIDTNSSISQKDIEKHFNLRKSTVTGIIKNMEKHGFIEKKVNPNDNRINNLLLTEKSIKIKATILEEIKNIETILIKNITEKEIDEFTKIIKKMINNI